MFGQAPEPSQTGDKCNGACSTSGRKTSLQFRQYAKTMPGNRCVEPAVIQDSRATEKHPTSDDALFLSATFCSISGGIWGKEPFACVHFEESLRISDLAGTTKGFTNREAD